MGHVRCDKCGSVWGVAGQEEGRPVQCPHCGAQTVASFVDFSACEGIPPTTTEPILVSYGFVPQAQLTETLLTGEMAYEPGRIKITYRGTLSTQHVPGMPPGGSSVSGILHAAEGREGSELEINTTEGEARFDDAKRVFSLKIPDGQWMSLRAYARAKATYPLMLGILLSAYGARLTPDQLGQLTARGKRARRILIGLAVGFVVLVLVMAVMSSRQ